MRRYEINRNSRRLTRKRDGLLKRLARVGPFVDGSVVMIARTCGNSRFCHCSHGDKHVSAYLTYSLKGKTHTLYIPVGLESQVKLWSARYRQLKDLIRQVGAVQKEIIRTHVQEKQRRQGRR